MGLFSKSSSSSSSTSVETTSVGAQDESTAISIGDGATANFLDAGAVTAALDLAKQSIGKSFEASTKIATDAGARLDNTQSGGAQRLLYLGVAALAVLAFVFMRK